MLPAQPCTSHYCILFPRVPGRRPWLACLKSLHFLSIRFANLALVTRHDDYGAVPDPSRILYVSPNSVGGRKQAKEGRDFEFVKTVVVWVRKWEREKREIQDCLLTATKAQTQTHAALSPPRNESALPTLFRGTDRSVHPVNDTSASSAGSTSVRRPGGAVCPTTSSCIVKREICDTAG
jgi:hypothetical protein